MAPVRPKFDYNTPELAAMLETSVLRVRDHEHLDSSLADYVRCEPHERTVFEERGFREIWEHRVGKWNWEGKQPGAKENAEYHLLHQVRPQVHCRALHGLTVAGSKEVLPR